MELDMCDDLSQLLDVVRLEVDDIKSEDTILEVP